MHEYLKISLQVCGSSNTLSIKPTPSLSSDASSLCRLPGVSMKVNSGRPGSYSKQVMLAGKEETTDLSYSSTFWEKRYPASLVNGKNQRIHKKLKNLATRQSKKSGAQTYRKN